MSVRVPVRLLAAAAALAAAALAAVPGALSAPAMAADGHPGQARAQQPVVSIAITSMTPTIAGPGAKGTVTVSGIVSNATAGTIPGLSVQLWSSGNALAGRAAMDSFLTAQGPSGMDSPAGPAVPLAAVPAHAIRPWSLTLRARQVGMTTFGVYPVAVQLAQGTAQLGVARTFLPFWPGKPASRALKRVSIAWVWPLIDTPHRVACPALLNNSLAADVAGSGRLGQLLAAGQTPAGRQAHLTWAIDPALLSDVSAMTRPYRVGGKPACTGAARRPASPAAQTWLRGVRAVAGQQDFFVTPYDDADVAALTHRGLDSELANAFADGRAQAQALLGQAQRTAPAAAGGRGGSRQTGLIVWPADGAADYSVLESLAANKIGTVVLDAGMMPPAVPVSFTPSAVTTTPDGLGNQLNVLLADTTIERILAMPAGSVPAAGRSVPSAGTVQATAFARAQWFLAETAMIAAEAPTARSLVVTPPRHWDPGTGLADSLLNDTVSAPWLRTDSLAGLVAARPSPGQVRRQQPVPRHVFRAELRSSLLRQVRHASGQIRLLGLILVHPGPRYLSPAIDAVESSAWRGAGGQRSAEDLLHRLKLYVSAQQQQVQIVDTQRVTLGGKSGEVPVSIRNKFPHTAIRVWLHVGVPSTGQVTIGHFTYRVTVDAQTQRTIKIPVRAAAAGSTTLTLWLTTWGGRQLPGSVTHLTVEATHFGTFAIVIIGIALAVFVLTAAARAFRRGGEPGGDDAGDSQEEDTTGLDRAYAAPEADTVGQERADESYPAKEPDEHASTQGRADRR